MVDNKLIHYREWREQSLNQISNEEKKLRKVREFIKRQKLEIDKKRKALEKAREDWKADMKALKCDENVDDRILRNVKKILEQRAIKLNEETALLNKLNRLIVLKKNKLKILREQIVERGKVAQLSFVNDDISSSPTSDRTSPEPDDGKQYLKDYQEPVGLGKILKNIENELASIRQALKEKNQNKENINIDGEPIFVSTKDQFMNNLSMKWNNYCKMTEPMYR